MTVREGAARRACYVCGLPIPNDELEARQWEAFKDDWSSILYYCPKHRRTAPKRLATIGEAISLKKARRQ